MGARVRERSHPSQLSVLCLSSLSLLAEIYSSAGNRALESKRREAGRDIKIEFEIKRQEGEKKSFFLR